VACLPVVAPPARDRVMIAAMGASGWDYFVPYQQDVTAALRELQQRVFDDDAFFWYPEDEDEPFPAPKPRTLAELERIKETDEFWEVGTHSILDLDRVIGPTEEDHDGTLRAAPREEIVRLFGTAMPTRAQFEAAYDRGMGDVPFARGWSGFYLVLADGAGRPSEIAIWG